VLLAALALATLGCAARTAPSASTQAHLRDAEAALAVKDYDAARAAYDRAVDTAPDATSARLAVRERADARLFLGDLDGAAGDLARLTELAPRDPAAWHDLGIVRANQGDRAGARDALYQAKTLAPDDARPRLALAALLWASGDRAAADREYQALLELDLPEPVRAKVVWAIATLAAPAP